jgi:hypothetical protein
MTLFDILRIPETESPITFNDGRFYAYKNMLVDIHNKLPLTLSEITPNNKLFKQLNIDSQSLLIHVDIKEENGVIKRVYIPTLKIIIPELNNLYIKYYETGGDELYHLVHTENNICTHHYTHTKQLY